MRGKSWRPTIERLAGTNVKIASVIEVNIPLNLFRHRGQGLGTWFILFLAIIRCRAALDQEGVLSNRDSTYILLGAF